LSQDAVDVGVVGEPLGQVAKKVRVDGGTESEVVDEFAAESGEWGKGDGVDGIRGEEEEEVEELVHHRDGLVDFVRGVGELGTFGSSGKPVEEVEPVEDADDSDRWVGEDNEGGLEEDDVLVVGVLTEGVVLVVEVLRSDAEAVADPDTGLDLSDESDGCRRRRVSSLSEP
jgi:hypothetical protein